MANARIPHIRETRVLFGSLQRQVFLARVLVDELHARHNVHVHVLVVAQMPQVYVHKRIPLHLAEHVNKLSDQVPGHSDNPVSSILERHDSLVICHNL